MKRFLLVRDEDVSGVSGLGTVAEGVVFQDGTTVIRWMTNPSSIGIYRSPADCERIHGHGGRTRMVFGD